MLTFASVDAAVSQAQSFDRTIACDVGLNDFGDIGSGNSTVPDAFAIDDDRRAVLALVEAAGFVGPDSAFQSEKVKLSFEGAL